VLGTGGAARAIVAAPREDGDAELRGLLTPGRGPGQAS
jgi:hypothetical protein